MITARGGIQQSLARRVVDALPLLRLWTVRELRTRYRQSVLHASWSVIQPAVLLLTYGFVLTSVLDVGHENVPYLTFAWAGLAPFAFVQQSLGQGVGSIQQAGNVISKVYFPREILPLSIVGAAGVDLGITTTLLVVISWVQIGPPSVHLLALVLVDVVLVLWVAGLTVLVAALTVFRRDLLHAMPLLLRALFIVSPVMYSASVLEDRAPVLSTLNPVTVVIQATRDTVIRHRWPAFGPLAIHAAVGALLLVSAILVVRRFERTMSDRV